MSPQRYLRNDYRQRGLVTHEMHAQITSPSLEMSSSVEKTVAVEDSLSKAQRAHVFLMGESPSAPTGINILSAAVEADGCHCLPNLCQCF